MVIMKTKNIRLSILLFSTMALFASCSDYNFNENIEINEDEVWDPEQVTTNMKENLTNIYLYVPNGYSDLIGYQDCVTDNAATNQYDASDYDVFNVGNYTEASLPDSDIWTTSYQGIYYANRFVADVDAFANAGWEDYELTSDRIAFIDAYRAEAMTLKAFFYVELLRRYGPVPLIDTADSTYDPSAAGSVSTPTLSEFVAFVAQLCENSYDGLYASQVATTDLGRIIKETSRAILSRLYLYAASLSTGTERDGYLDSCISVSSAMLTLTGSELDTFGNMFNVTSTTHTANASEVLMQRRYTLVRTIATANYPIGFESAMGNTNPSHDLVEAFYKSQQGSMDAVFTPSATAYADLASDQRFAATIVYDGETFNDREIEIFEGGADATTTPTSPGSTTGYYLAKYMPSAAGNLVTGAVADGYQCWFLMRYAEVYYNLAEALYYRYADATESTTGKSSLDILNVIRGKRGASDVALTGADYLSFLQNDRRCEFAFEGMYFFDVKRWNNMGIFTPNKTVKKVTINSSRTAYTVSTISGETRFGNLADYPLPATETLNGFL